MPRKNEATERMCIVERRQRPVGELIRFVLSPDGAVTPDLKRTLPGRGTWISARKSAVETALRRNLFARGFKRKPETGEELPGIVENLLWKRALSALGFANKAGLVVTGFAKVEARIRQSRPAALLHAAECGADGKAKLGRLLDAVWSDDRPIILDRYQGTHLDLALGRSNVIHAALMDGPASDNFLEMDRSLARYLCATAEDFDTFNSGADDKSARQNSE